MLVASLKVYTTRWKGTLKCGDVECRWRRRDGRARRATRAHASNESAKAWYSDSSLDESGSSVGAWASSGCFLLNISVLFSSTARGLLSSSKGETHCEPPEVSTELEGGVRHSGCAITWP